MIQLVIAWTCVGVFVATALITLLALVRVIRLAEKKYLDRLFKALVIEVVAICLGVFTGKIELPEEVEKRVEGRGVAVGEERGRAAAVDALQPEILKLTLAVEQRDAILTRNLTKLNLTPAETEALKQPVKLDPRVLDSAKRRAAVRPR